MDVDHNNKAADQGVDDILWKSLLVLAIKRCGGGMAFLEEFAVLSLACQHRILTVLHAFSERVTVARQSSVAARCCPGIKTVRRYG